MPLKTYFYLLENLNPSLSVLFISHIYFSINYFQFKMFSLWSIWILYKIFYIIEYPKTFITPKKNIKKFLFTQHDVSLFLPVWDIRTYGLIKRETALRKHLRARSLAQTVTISGTQGQVHFYFVFSSYFVFSKLNIWLFSFR